MYATNLEFIDIIALAHGLLSKASLIVYTIRYGDSVAICVGTTAILYRAITALINDAILIPTSCLHNHVCTRYIILLQAF